MGILPILAFLVTAQSPSEVPVHLTGTKSKVEIQEARLATNEREWVRIWLRNLGDTTEVERIDKRKAEPHEIREYMFEKAVPRIDFRTHVVLAFFGGSEPAFGYWLHS